MIDALDRFVPGSSPKILDQHEVALGLIELGVEHPLAVRGERQAWSMERWRLPQGGQTVDAVGGEAVEGEGRSAAATLALEEVKAVLEQRPIPPVAGG